MKMYFVEEFPSPAQQRTGLIVQYLDGAEDSTQALAMARRTYKQIFDDSALLLRSYDGTIVAIKNPGWDDWFFVVNDSVRVH